MDQLLGATSDRASLVFSRKPMWPFVARKRVPRLRGHDDQRVAEVDLIAERVGEDAVLEDLQQDVGDVGMRLLDLVEQHDASTDCGARAR